MAHEIESMAYVGEVPWHGLGNPVQEGVSIDEMTKQAGLDWSVSKRPVRFVDGTGETAHTFKDKFVLARDSDDKPYSVVSHRYKPVQPKQIMQFFSDLVDLYGYKLETAGSLRDGKRIWCLARTGDQHLVNGNDPINGFLLLATSYDLTFSTFGQETSIRVVCNNTLGQAMGDKTGRVTITHCQDFNAESVKAELGIGRENWSAFTKAIDLIAKVKIDSVKAAEVISNVFQVKPLEMGADPNRSHAANVVDLFTRQAYIGADLAGDSAWGLLNSLTEYVDFRKRALGQSNRLDSAWFGDGAKLKERALNELIQLAA